MPGKTYIGTSGWNYKTWHAGFYGDTPQKQWLPFCAERFTSIEVNGTFYRLQPQSTFKKWRDETPDGFPFAIKGHRPRFVTKLNGMPRGFPVLQRLQEFLYSF